MRAKLDFTLSAPSCIDDNRRATWPARENQDRPQHELTCKDRNAVRRN
jgi:hypothetical protein